MAERRFRDVQTQVMRALQQGITITCEKTKSLREGGKMGVSIGRNQTAVKGSGRPYRLITTGRYPESARDIEFGSAIECAQWYIDFVGRDIAWQSVRSAFARVKENRRAA